MSKSDLCKIKGCDLRPNDYDGLCGGHREFGNHYEEYLQILEELGAHNLTIYCGDGKRHENMNLGVIADIDDFQKIAKWVLSRQKDAVEQKLSYLSRNGFLTSLGQERVETIISG